MPFDRDAVKQRAAELAARGVFVGTSSWKYPGWLGLLYSPQRYEYRGDNRLEGNALTFEEAKAVIDEYRQRKKGASTDAPPQP